MDFPCVHHHTCQCRLRVTRLARPTPAIPAAIVSDPFPFSVALSFCLSFSFVCSLTRRLTYSLFLSFFVAVSSFPFFPLHDTHPYLSRSLCANFIIFFQYSYLSCNVNSVCDSFVTSYTTRSFITYHDLPMLNLYN